MKLPSVQAAENYYNDKPYAALEILLTTLARSALIGTGIYVSGVERDPKKAWCCALAGAVAIEAYVLHGCWKEHQNKQGV